MNFLLPCVDVLLKVPVSVMSDEVRLAVCPSDSVGCVKSFKVVLLSSCPHSMLRHREK
jgi:hypothetical protein